MAIQQDTKLAEKVHGEVIECIGLAEENGKKELNFFLPYDFTEMAASLLEGLLKESGYQVRLKSFPTRIGDAYVIYIKIQ